MGNIKIGRTIAERRERLESSSERIAAQKKGKKKKRIRVVLAILLYVFLASVLTFGIFLILKGRDVEMVEVIKIPVTPTIEVVDEDNNANGNTLTNRMNEYIGLAEKDFRELGYTPTKAVIPMGSIREVDFYFSDFSGYVKTVVDRGAGGTVEDFGRMVKYLQGIDKMDFEYIDIRVEEKGYWK